MRAIGRDRTRPAAVEDPTCLGWHKTTGMNFDACHLDNRWHWERHGIDPDKHIAAFRETHDEEAVKRGLIFVGEVRLGQEIQRQYLVPTRWLRFKAFMLRVRYADQEDCVGWFWPKEELPRKGAR